MDWSAAAAAAIIVPAALAVKVRRSRKCSASPAAGYGFHSSTTRQEMQAQEGVSAGAAKTFIVATRKVSQTQAVVAVAAGKLFAAQKQQAVAKITQW